MDKQTKVKLCGIYRPEDVPLLNSAKPDYCGFILNFPKSHRNLTLDQAAALAKDIDPEITRVGVFVDRPMEEVEEALERGIIHIAQLHGREEEDYLITLRQRTGKPVWKAFRIRTPEDLEKAKSSAANLILLDNGQGTGETFDWSALSAGVGRPFALAGGLTPENIPAAIAAVHPDVVDLSSGVETDRVKDGNKMKQAVLAAHDRKE